MNKQLIAALATGAIVCGAMAQATTQPTKQPAGTQPAPPPAKSPLAGPKVPDRTGKPTIVERGMDGKVTKIDEWPALAAVRKLKLDEKTKAAVAKLEAGQAAAMDRMLSENLLEVAAVANFFQSGDVKEGLAGIKKLKEGNPILEERSLLTQRIGALLPKEQGEELSQIVQEYWNALIQEADEAAKTRGEKSGAAKVAGAEALRLLGQDIKASYERVIGQQVKDFDALVKTLGLSGEQESRVRKIVDDAFTKAKGNTAKMSKSDVFWKVWKELNAEQRSVLVEQFKGKEK